MSAAPARAGGRWTALDAARGLAVVAMVVFHLIWDLAHFGYIAPTIPWSAPVRAFGHSIAFSFLFIAGVSLALAHRDAIHWPAFWRRFAIIAGAAALVSAGTYAVFPDAYVFFGILHVIAAASLAAIPLLRAPWPLTLGVALLVLAAPWMFASPRFDADGLMWLGLGTREPMTQDWRPFFPWVGALLMGVAARRALSLRFLWVGGHEIADGSRNLPKGRSARALPFLGRHSLLIYLAHQPALFALFTALSFFAPAMDDRAAFVAADFVAACEKQCVIEGGVQEICNEICVCTSDEAMRTKALDGAGEDAERGRRLNAIARKCAGK